MPEETDKFLAYCKAFDALQKATQEVEESIQKMQKAPDLLKDWRAKLTDSHGGGASMLDELRLVPAGQAIHSAMQKWVEARCGIALALKPVKQYVGHGLQGTKEADPKAEIPPS